MKIAFIGLGNVGGKLAGSLLRNGFDLSVRDLEAAASAACEQPGFLILECYRISDGSHAAHQTTGATGRLPCHPPTAPGQTSS